MGSLRDLHRSDTPKRARKISLTPAYRYVGRHPVMVGKNLILQPGSVLCQEDVKHFPLQYLYLLQHIDESP